MNDLTTLHQKPTSRETTQLSLSLTLLLLSFPLLTLEAKQTEHLES